MLRLLFPAVAMIGCMWLSGCDFPEIKRPPAAGVGGLDPDMGSTVSGGGSSTTDSNAVQPPAAAPQPAENRIAAQVGVGRRGHLDPQGRISIYSSSVNAFFRTRENLTYNVQIPHAMNLYKATHGRAPRTHEEFWREIIQINNLRMPELNEGYTYEYDPQTEELYVVPQ